MKQRIFLSPPHMSGNEQTYINEAFETNWIAPLGPNVDAFEKEMCGVTGAGAALATSSGTAAIHLALKLLNIQQGDTVFCSSLTFIASANPVLYEKAEPVFIDSEPDSWNMSPLALQRAFQDAIRERKLPKAVIVVNLYGQSADYDPILEICSHYNVPVIEDAAESLGAHYKHKKSGTLGTFGIFSFNGNKIITSSGGGMLVSNDPERIERAKFLATQARDQAVHYEHSVLGFNYRLSNILAGVGRAQLELLSDRVNARRERFQCYYEALHRFDGIDFMPEADYGLHTRWLTTLTLNPDQTGVSSAEVISALANENIESRPVWKPLHLQPLFKRNKYYPHEEQVSVSDELFLNGLCLPSGSNLTLEQQEIILNTFSKLVKQPV
ncbi:DegT/DnrJ/EryC1/StrS family aminotransferase [Fictibacillus sp. KIGAM418]|uniref:DegT/DnrJ/EryC1/StrS family aminotransferase n=1 Tax=Fictibacillus marinisediminis TaxID=2878389 RepID=A0A9X1XFB5_9BACL|nr:DegT/DnrJ/EryC1/StrS family aminotransferase [Fictibacillus marinisediminis]MCK6258815.1 DegT/DnrJ/EryC1/StrS family aminotransferase [Fictibacillus marinisediminis]